MVDQIRSLAVGSFLVASAALSACAPTRAVEMPGCPAMGLASAPEVSERIKLDTFSVKSPQFGTWCVQRRTSRELAYASTPMFGHVFRSRPDMEFAANTLAILVTYIRTLEAPLENVEQLQAFHRRWMQAGGRISPSNGERWADLVLLPRYRFRLLTYAAIPDVPIKGKCIQYESVLEERDNPRVPDKILHLHEVGVFCLDPIRKSQLIIATLSERYIPGKKFRPKLFAELKEKMAKPLFASLRLGR